MSEPSRRAARRAALGAALMASATVIFAQSAVSKQVRASAGDDPDFSRAVREWTTRPEFISPLVDHLPKAGGVPYHLIGGLHSGEVGPSEMLMELAYRIAAEDSPIVNQIRDRVIVSITPVADPTSFPHRHGERSGRPSDPNRRS